MKISRTHLLFILAAAIFVLLSTSTIARAQNGADGNPLSIDLASEDFSDNPALLDRITGSPHGYFRFINIPFSREVCRRYEEILAGTPTFNLHGDAHIEQYAITDLGRGLTDFDDSSTGPAALDIMRFGVSLHLACYQLGWPDGPAQALTRFLDGYRQALRDPDFEADEPKIVHNIKKDFEFDAKEYFAWIESIMEPISQEQSEKLLTAMRPYMANMYIEKPDLPQHYLAIKSVGALKLGIGSAQDIKYLVRTEGETENPLDDVVLEVKQVRDLSGITCITIAQQNDPFWVLIGQARIAYEPYKLLGYIHLDGLSFWVHSWVHNYQEIEIGESFQSIDELAEIAFDVGVQLGRGHTNQIAAPLDAQLRREQLRFLERYKKRIRKSCRVLANLTIAAWEDFRARVSSE